MHRHFAEQLQKARTKSGVVDLARLGEIVSAAYEEADRARLHTDRSIALMIEELDQLNRDLEEQIRARTADLHARESELKAQNTLFETAVNNMSQALLLMDESARLVMCNTRYVELYRIPPDLARPGCGLVDLLRARIASGTWDGDPQEYVDKVRRVLKGGKSASWLSDLPDGRTVSVLINPLPGGGWVTTHEDVTERRVAEMRIAHMARHDGLTNLANREYLRERLTEAIARLGHGERLAALYLDLDQFKGINDTLGHSVGDELLKAVADRLKAVVGEHDIVARIGGDEFVIVHASGAGRDDAASMAGRVRAAIAEPFHLSGHVVATEASIGISFAPDHAREPNDLLKHADIALYRAKSERRGSWQFFEPEMDERIKTRHALERDLREALVNGEFEVHYQPVVNVRTQRISGCEALIRWHHPAHGLVPNADFISIAEEMGLIIPIGEWVIREACAEAALWPSDVKVAVNLSPVQLRSPKLLQVVVVALAAAGIEPSRMELEITETALMHNTAATLSALHRLREIGISISMDDFGTGYSSLSNLRSFPFDKIKIDQCFIRGLPSEDDSAAIVRAVVGLARSLKMITTAEGVETVEQAEQIKLLGCDEIQGYYYSRALPAIEVRQMLARQTPRLARTA
jgi:diguanylate cyclase (GGDEF)-like protein